MDLNRIKEILDSGIIENYVLGLTTEEESQELESYARQYPEIRNEIKRFGLSLETLSIEQKLEPPAHLKQNILSQISGEENIESIKPVTPSKSWTWLPIAASLVLGIMASSVYFNQKLNSSNSEIDRLSQELVLLQEACTQNEFQRNVFTLIDNANTEPVLLSGSTLAPNCQVVVYWNESQREAYMKILNIPSPPEGTTYQMWADVEGEMINMGVLDGNNTDFVSVPFINNTESLNITLEPAGGSEHPTVEKIYASGPV